MRNFQPRRSHPVAPRAASPPSPDVSHMIHTSIYNTSNVSSPGPGSFDADVRPVKKTSPTYSMGKRQPHQSFMRRAEKKAQQVPGPAKYHKDQPHIAMGKTNSRYRKLHHIDGEKVLQSPSYSFSLGSTDRLGKPTTIQTKRPVLSKEHARANYGMHSPGPWRYSPKTTLTRAGASGVGSSHRPYKNTPSYQFSRASRFA